MRRFAPPRARRSFAAHRRLRLGSPARPHGVEVDRAGPSFAPLAYQTTVRGAWKLRKFALPVTILLAASSAAVAAEPLKCPLDAPYDPHNAFAQILEGTKKQAIVYSGPLVLAFIPNRWDNPGHVLIIPRRPVRNLSDVTDKEMVAVLHLVRRIAVAQERAFGSTGYTLEQNNGRNQSVCHAHFHVIPNTPEQKVNLASQEQMEAIASKLRAALPGE